MSPRSNTEWERWGRDDPLYGVASWDGRAAGERNAWTDEDFYATGTADWASFLDQWRQYGVEAGVCVELGCGAGRMTAAMARHFSHVHGVDVAQGMLDRAAEAVGDLPVTLHLGDGTRLPLEDASTDAAFSTHVFQHLDTAADAADSWAEIARVLKPGGTAMVHLPVRIWPLGMERLESLYQLRRVVGDVRAFFQRRRMTRGGPPIMRGQSFLWRQWDEDLRRTGFVDVELRVFRVASNDDQHPVIVARKAGGT